MSQLVGRAASAFSRCPAVEELALDLVVQAKADNINALG